MKRLSSWRLLHPTQRRILWMLAFMLLGVVALGFKEAHRYRVIRAHQGLVKAEQAHLDLVQTFRVEMGAALRGFERLASITDVSGLLALEAQIGKALTDARAVLVVMHQGGEFLPIDAKDRGSESIFLDKPMPPN